MTLVANRLTRTGPVRRESALVGVGLLSRHILRRDRVRMSVWVLSIAAFTAYFTVALRTVFDEAALAARAAVMSTPTGIIMGGPGYGLDDYTPSVAMANEGVTWIILALAIMSIVHVVRHTRAEEESSRSELVRASAVGRHAPAVAALATLVLHLLVIAGAGAALMLLAGEEIAPADALGMMLGCAGSALVFGAVALLTSQITAHARTATGLALAVFAASFVVRAAGDVQEVGGSALSWFSPIGWAQQMRAFVDLRWWPLALSLAATLVLLVVAALLANRRDFGAGLLAARPGRADARWMLRTPLALAWIQQRGGLFWTSLGTGLMFFGTGTMMSSLNDMVSDLVETNPVLGQLFGTDPSAFAASFLGVMALFIGVTAGAYAVVMGQRPKGEEGSGRLELQLAGPVSRWRWLGAQVVIAGSGTIIVIAVSTYAMWAGTRTVGLEDPGLADFSLVVASYVPACLVFLGLTTALYGWAPRLTGAGWLPLAVGFFLAFFGSLFELPEWVQGISPFHWIPDAFGDEYDAAGPVTLAAIALALLLIGILGLRRRDLQTA
ncbi:ABC transporter permease [Microbacterium sp. G2-8]|uniref:ABC transporter permease n=1 Tax=Microbacterium sp. G2-8 TaxID=2842454 RepID=UPI001C894A25|nr:hypothetical protein [Microbacterium sp. G2-8]